MQQPSPQQTMPPGMQPGLVQPPQQMEKLDNISKCKSLIGPLRESLRNVFNSAAQLLTQNNVISAGKQVDVNAVPRFDKHLEEFFSICDQFELHLITAKKCIQQASNAQAFLPVPVVPQKNESMQQENTLSYGQFLELVNTQITYAKDVHDTLVMAAQNL